MSTQVIGVSLSAAPRTNVNEESRKLLSHLCIQTYIILQSYKVMNPEVFSVPFVSKCLLAKIRAGPPEDRDLYFSVFTD